MQRQSFKRLPLFLMIVCMLSLLPISVSASEYEPDHYIIDDAGLLSNDELSDLEEDCRDASLAHQTVICIVTTPDFSGNDIKEWQRQYFLEHFADTSGDTDGIMLAVSMAERDWGIVGFGSAQDAFTTYGREHIADLILDDLSDGEYDASFQTFVSLADEFLSEAENGTTYDTDHTYRNSIPIPFIITGAFLLSLLISLFIVLTWKRHMNTRIVQDNASEYLQQDSFHLTDRSDIFLYHTISKTPRPKHEDVHHNMHSDSSGTSGKF